MNDENNVKSVVYYLVPVMQGDVLCAKRVILKEFDNWKDAANYIQFSDLSRVCICGYTTKEDFEKNYRDKIYEIR